LRIQAGILLEHNNEVGVTLMKRMINGFPTETSSTVFGNEQLGDYYFQKSDFENAIKYYDIVNDFYKKEAKYRDNTSWIADLKLVDVILKMNLQKRFNEAYKICKNYKVKDITLNSDIFYYYELYALICSKLDKKDEAKKQAEKALEYAKITEPQFRYHKDVGLVTVSNKQTIMLSAIADMQAVCDNGE
jgi:tetratricopeptide (TPR) repeat protein